MVWCPGCNADRSTRTNHNKFIFCAVCGTFLFDQTMQGFLELKKYIKSRGFKNSGPRPRQRLFAVRTSKETLKEGQTKEISKTPNKRNKQNPG